MKHTPSLPIPSHWRGLCCSQVSGYPLINYSKARKAWMLQCLSSGKDPSSWTLLCRILCLALERAPSIRIQRGLGRSAWVWDADAKTEGRISSWVHSLITKGLLVGFFFLLFEKGEREGHISPISPSVFAFRHSLQSQASCIWVNNVIICFQKWFGTNSSWKSFPRSYISVSFISQAGSETSWLSYISFPSPPISCLLHWDRTT